MDRGALAVYGPGDLVRHHSHGDDAASMLEQSRLEQQLVGDGWSLEQMTTERRSGADRRHRVRGDDRRRSLRVIDQHSTDTP
jgi:hypothetical protein